MKDGRLSKAELKTLMSRWLEDPQIKTKDFLELAKLYAELLGPRRPRKRRATREALEFDAVRRLEAQSSRLPS